MALLALLPARLTQDAHAGGFPPPNPRCDHSADVAFNATASVRAKQRGSSATASATQILSHSKRHATAHLSFAALWGTRAGMQACRQVSAWEEGR